MNYVTTNIRLYEEDYLRLKEEAVQNRKSLSAIIREKVNSSGTRTKSPVRLVAEMKKLAQKNAKYFKGVDGVKIIREMRYESKW